MSRLRPLLIALVLLACVVSLAKAGQGPQNVAVVINGRSPLSLAVAHRYAQLRQIPTANLLYLDWDGSPIGTDVETFRQKILLPLTRLLEERGIAQHITTIAYSADFPYVVDFKADLQEDSKVDRTARQFHQGSLTGLTYLAPLVLAKDVGSYSNLGSNFYYRASLQGKLLTETRDFPPGARWNAEGEITTGEGRRYYLSTMLAYTSGRGNSLAEVDRYLTNSLRADGTYPVGKIYFLTNTDVRARTREPSFKSSLTLLERLGIAAEITEGVLPRERSDIMGAMIGSVDYRFADSGSQVHGGAICENLTSFGGIMRENGGQTALSECLRAGAAGSSGTITEPYAIQAKFPHPLIHVHYAQGCSLAEAFYQSVQGPYQLLIVGDPLARPWATIPTVTVGGIANDKPTMSGKLTLAPGATTVQGKQVCRYELYVDGQLKQQAPIGGELSIDTTVWADGDHELRVVAYDDSPIATQGTWVRQVRFANHGGNPVTVRVEPAGTLVVDQAFTVHVEAPGAKKLELFSGDRSVATAATDRGSWKIRGAEIGLGRGSLQLVVKHGDNGPREQHRLLIPLEIIPAAPRSALEAVTETKPGIRLIREGHEPAVVERLADDWLTKAGVEAAQAIRLESVFRIDRDDLYQFQLDSSGQVELLVDGQPLLSQDSPIPSCCYALASLATGMHRLEIRATIDGGRRLNVSFGNCGTQAVAATLFHHVE